MTRVNMITNCSAYCVLLAEVWIPAAVQELTLYELCVHIRESVDSLYRDDMDMLRPPYIERACDCLNTAFVSLFRLSGCDPRGLTLARIHRWHYAQKSHARTRHLIPQVQVDLE